MVTERIYTVNLSKAYSAVRLKRARKAVKLLKIFAARHMSCELNNVKVSAGVNSLIWTRSAGKPPRKVKVKMVKEKQGESNIDMVKVMLLDEKWKVIKINYPEEEGKAGPAPKKTEEAEEKPKKEAKKEKENETEKQKSHETKQQPKQEPEKTKQPEPEIPEVKQTKNDKQLKEAKDTKEVKDVKEVKDIKETKETK